ncbi:hypothetical protein [Azospirillum argentinense]
MPDFLDLVDFDIWYRYIAKHSRTNRIPAFLRLVREGLIQNDLMYWGLLRASYEDSEQLYRSLKHLEDLFYPTDRPIHHDLMMLSEEREHLESMPDEFFVFRGVSARSHCGWSWTTDRAVAEWFACRSVMGKRKPTLLLGKVQKAQVIAYLGGAESEFIVAPAHVTILGYERVTKTFDRFPHPSIVTGEGDVLHNQPLPA